MRRQAIISKELQKVSWQSDQSIVPKKQSNVCGGKGETNMRLEDRDTFSAHRGGQRKTTKLSSITYRAKENPKMQFTSLVHLLDEDFLKECFGELRRNKAPGIDGMTAEEYKVCLDRNIKALVSGLKTRRYKPQPVRRVYIPKMSGGMRPLGIPSLEDKIVQMGIKKILEAIYEQDFVDVSYGFRPERSCHQAIKGLDNVIMTKPINYVVDMDIEKFFDTVNHNWMMKFLRHRVKDPNLLQLVAKFLKAGVMEEGKYIEVEKGTPQGGILSPLLANIYLHYVLDLWFNKVISKQIKGYAHLTRYADDFVVCFRWGIDAKAFSWKLKQRLAKFGLGIAEEKSRIIEFGRAVWHEAQREGKKVATFNFLGFTFYCAKTREGKFKVGQRTTKGKLRQTLKELNQWLKENRCNKFQDWWETLKKKLTGHYRYFGVSGNKQRLESLYRQTFRLAFKWVNRRSQKESYTGEEFCRFAKYNPLPSPKIYHWAYRPSS